MANIEIYDDVEKAHRGRPVSKRTNEIYLAVLRAMNEGKHGIRVMLEEDEVGENWVRFYRRAASAARKAGVKASISRGDNNSGNIRIGDKDA